MIGSLVIVIPCCHNAIWCELIELGLNLLQSSLKEHCNFGEFKKVLFPFPICNLCLSVSWKRYFMLTVEES